MPACSPWKRDSRRAGRPEAAAAPASGVCGADTASSLAGRRCRLSNSVIRDSTGDSQLQTTVHITEPRDSARLQPSSRAARRPHAPCGDQGGQKPGTEEPAGRAESRGLTGRCCPPLWGADCGARGPGLAGAGAPVLTGRGRVPQPDWVRISGLGSGQRSCPVTTETTSQSRAESAAGVLTGEHRGAAPHSTELPGRGVAIAPGSGPSRRPRALPRARPLPRPARPPR